MMDRCRKLQMRCLEMHTSGTGSSALALYAQLDKSMAGSLIAEGEQGLLL
jgi:hypothetical protein